MDAFRRYLWLIQLLYNKGCLTLKEIQESWWDFSNGEELSERTFHRHKQRIAEIFGIEIIYKAYNKTYEIDSRDSLDNGEVQKWLFEAFTFHHELINASSLMNRILPEEVPSGRSFFSEIIQSLKSNYKLNIVYRSHYHTEDKKYLVHPYCLKAFRQRWYIYGLEEYSGQGLTLALERILKMNITDEIFELPSDFDARERYADVFGITVYQDEPPRIIRFKVFDEQAKYILALPLHHSQSVVEQGENFIIFEVFLRPSYELYREFLSYGNTLEIVAPLAIKERVEGMK